MSINKYILVTLGFGLAFVSSTVNALPSIEHWSLANGTRIYFVEASELPLVQISAIFDAGSARDKTGKYGIACLTNAMLDEGAGELDADEIANQLDGVGAQLSAGCGRDMASLELRSLVAARSLEPALAVFAQILQQPSFPDDSFQRLREQSLLSLRRVAQSPAATVSKAFYESLYGNHPYAHSPRGDESGLTVLSRADLVDFHRSHYVAANLVLAIVGDVSKGEAKQIATQLVGKLPAGTPAPPLPPVNDLDEPRELDIAFPSSQAHIRVGQPGLERDDPDYFPLYVGNYILGGGGMVSRLYHEIREKRGLAYSTYSYFYPMRRKGPFTVGLQTENSQRDEALVLVKSTLTRFIESGPTEKELLGAKKNITGGFPLRIDSNNDVLEYLNIIGFYKLPLTYLNDFVAKVDAVTTSQIRDAFRRRVDPKRLVTVVLGGQP